MERTEFWTDGTVSAEVDVDVSGPARVVRVSIWGPDIASAEMRKVPVRMMRARAAAAEWELSQALLRLAQLEEQAVSNGAL